MTLPAHIRVNTLVPFPAQVSGAAFIQVTKVNGRWVVTPSFGNLAVGTPAGQQQLLNDYLVAWDSVQGNYFRLPLSFFAVGGPGGASPVQRAITAGPVTILATDQYLNLNLPSSQTITLPGYVSRNGVPLNFKDVGMQATANPLTIAAAAGETIDGFASVPLDTNGMEVNLTPFNDGLNTGWFVS